MDITLGLGLDIYRGGLKTETVPESIGNLELELDYRFGIGLNGSKVASWADQSGNGNHFSQSVGASQPLWGTTEVDFGAVPLSHLIAGANYIFSTGTGAAIVALARSSNNLNEARYLFHFGTRQSTSGLGYGMVYNRRNFWGEGPTNKLGGTSALGGDSAYHTVMIDFDFTFGAIQTFYDVVAKGTGLGMDLFFTAANIAESPTRVLNVSGPMTIGLTSAPTPTEPIHAFDGAIKALYVYSKVLTGPELVILHNHLLTIP